VSRQRPARSARAAALGGLDPGELRAGHRDACERTDLDLGAESLDRPRQGGRGREVQIRELERELQIAAGERTAVDHQVAPIQALARPARRRRAGAVALQRPGDRRSQQLPEREDVRAAERASHLGEPAPGEATVERRADERLDPPDRVPAALALRQGGGLEGDRRLRRGERLQPRGLRRDHSSELHLVHDARSLEIARHGHEAALAQIQDLPEHVEPPVRALAERHRERTAVQRMTADAEIHAPTLPQRADQVQASRVRGYGSARRAGEETCKPERGGCCR
jgi:hypothetical protein